MNELKKKNALNSIYLAGIAGKTGHAIDLERNSKLFTFKLFNIYEFTEKNGKLSSDDSYFTIEAFGKLALYCMKNFSPNARVTVHGHLKSENWKGRNGEEREKVSIIASEITFTKKPEKLPPLELTPEEKKDEERRYRAYLDMRINGPARREWLETVIEKKMFPEDDRWIREGLWLTDE